MKVTFMLGKDLVPRFVCFGPVYASRLLPGHILLVQVDRRLEGRGGEELIPGIAHTLRCAASLLQPGNIAQHNMDLLN